MKRIKAIIKFIQRDWSDYKYAGYKDGSDPDGATIRGWAWLWVKQLYAELQCKRHGHDWEDNSHCGPDSGSMGMDCKRCGYGFSTNLY